MPCKACLEGKKRRQQRLEAIRKHHAERRARGQHQVLETHRATVHYKMTPRELTASIMHNAVLVVSNRWK